MKKILLSAYIVTWVLLLSACGGGSKTSSLQAEGDTIRMKYSSLLQIVKHADYTVVTIRNPWDTLKVLHTYLLADREKPLPEHLPEGTVVRTPLQKSVIYSSVHCSLWSELDELKGIGGVCGLEYIKLPQIQERRQQHESRYRAHHRPPAGCHPAFSFRKQRRLRKSRQTEYSHYRMCRLHGNLCPGTRGMDAPLRIITWKGSTG